MSYGPIGLAMFLEAAWSIARVDLGMSDDRDGRHGVALATASLGVELMRTGMEDRLNADPELVRRVTSRLRATHQAWTS